MSERFINKIFVKKLTKMGSKTLTISCDQVLLDFLAENSSLSPSKIFQSAVIDLQNRALHNPELIEANKIIHLKQKQGDRYQKIVREYSDFIEKLKLTDQFNKEHLL